MPNHCQNVLKVRGAQGLLEGFALQALTAAEGPEVIAFESFFPMPENILPGPSGEGLMARLPGEPWQFYLDTIKRLHLVSFKDDWQERDAELIGYLKNIGCELERFKYGTTKSGAIVRLEGNLRCWYDWRVETFGTKWEPYDSVLIEGQNEYNFEFMTAWSPPTPFVVLLQEKFPELLISLRFAEPGNNLLGELTDFGAQLQGEFPEYPESEDGAALEIYYEAVQEYLLGG